MSLYNYTFMHEVEDYEIDEYTPHLEEVGQDIDDYKIYSLRASTFYFLLDKNTDKLFQFYAIDPEKLNNRAEYEDVIKAFLLIDH